MNPEVDVFSDRVRLEQPIALVGRRYIQRAKLSTFPLFTEVFNDDASMILFSHHLDAKKRAATKKLTRKSLIPLPPARFPSQKSAKAVGSATACPAQARCGLWQQMGHCTKCKVWQRNANPLVHGLSPWGPPDNSKAYVTERRPFSFQGQQSSGSPDSGNSSC